MTTLITAAILCVVFSHHPVLAQSTSFFQGIRILRVGEFHNHEVNSQSGEMWFGLFPVRSGYELKRTTIEVRPARDSLVDPDTSVMTGWGVTTNSKTQPIVLIRGIKNVKEGSVKTSFFGMSSLVAGKTIIFKLVEGRDSYWVHPESKSEKVRGVTSYRDYVLKLSFGNISQVIATFDRLADDGVPSVVWAGDLDGDGNLDLLLDLTTHYNISQYTLFLSSVAKPGELVRKVADFRHEGC